MNKNNIYYSLGTLSLALASISFYVILNYWIFGFFLISGLFLILKSNKKPWLKILTIILVPIISIFLFFIILFGLSDEAI
ncbi:hypothetical protein NG800_015230 [Epilithonimonas ginsengisoli]|uniref:Uncharacterized protein n=1 Tax=Epilithonimonas ginsengisoli TaxID=1245592 RepID=A0ABU4JKP2_9FLAO|nr:MULTISPECIES: hypothetical protein [Chryseobacterium group]MBV6881254.1 hypothetical protein [Epilithonimonas sp. FP105]MDW8550279.1 hypothetical protein [Epilithonimonas ginsengisoli]OAH69304.1 hypothetical protein AXA65_14790 [Chryseobacterium sp. FP211-J200]